MLAVDRLELGRSLLEVATFEIGQALIVEDVRRIGLGGQRQRFDIAWFQKRRSLSGRPPRPQAQE